MRLWRSTRFARSFLLLVAAALVMAVMSGCGDSSTAGTAEPGGDDLPPWVERVYPGPGSEISAATNVQVTHGVTSNDERVYLEINGTDVTTYARVGRGTLNYDPSRRPARPEPLPLEPGEYTATLERARVDPGGEITEILDEFTWQFTIL